MSSYPTPPPLSGLQYAESLGLVFLCDCPDNVCLALYDHARDTWLDEHDDRIVTATVECPCCHESRTLPTAHQVTTFVQENDQ